MSRVVCRRGIARGAESRVFSADDLLHALKGDDTEQVYAEVDSGGWLTARGAGAGGEGAGSAGGAALCVAARLAPHALAAGAHVWRRGGLRVRGAGPLAARAELLLWFADDALAALDMPVLTLRNIRGRRHYECHECGVSFDDPNPLKVHLFLSCAPYEPARFWREAAKRLSAATESAPYGPTPGPACGPTCGPACGPAPDGLAPAQLEALATEWGRSRGGHVCVYCGKLYSRRYGLKIHLRTHTGYRPLRCRHCLRAFGDPSNLNKHERLHAMGRDGREGREGRYACTLCGRALARRRDLERHMRTHTHTLTHSAAAEQ